MPALQLVAIDQLYSLYEDFLATMVTGMSLSRASGSYTVCTIRPGLPHEYVYNTLRSVADYHFKFTKQDGVLFMYGLKPQTNIHVVNWEHSQFRPIPSLTLVD